MLKEASTSFFSSDFYLKPQHASGLNVQGLFELPGASASGAFSRPKPQARPHTSTGIIDATQQAVCKLCPVCHNSKNAAMNDQEARLLEVEAGTAALVYRGVTFGTQGQPVEYLVSVNHPQRVVFKLADSPVNTVHSSH